MARTDVQLLPACRTPSLTGLRQVKELVLQLRGQRGGHFPQVELEPIASLDDAIQRACSDSEGSLVLACGFTTQEINEVLKQTTCKTKPCIISQPRDATERLHIPNASLFERRTITRVRSMKEGVRKAMLRIATRHLGELRPIREPDEFRRYFELRHRVWNGAGYLPKDSPLQAGGWEIDCCDRFSIPLGLFLPDGRLIACVRLVQEYGKESTEHVKTITALLNQKGDPAAIDAFSYKNKPEQPFDILWEFRGFRDYFASLVRARTSLAEVSRVAVDPEFRGCGIIEVLVDSLASLARVEGIDILLLACPEVIKKLYARCGFKQVPDLVSDRFFDIDRRSVVMDRRLSPKRR